MQIKKLSLCLSLIQNKHVHYLSLKWDPVFKEIGWFSVQSAYIYGWTRNPVKPSAPTTGKLISKKPKMPHWNTVNSYNQHTNWSIIHSLPCYTTWDESKYCICCNKCPYPNKWPSAPTYISNDRTNVKWISETCSVRPPWWKTDLWCGTILKVPKSIFSMYLYLWWKTTCHLRPQNCVP